MTWLPPHPHDRHALSQSLIQVLLFVENLNSQGVELLATSGPNDIETAEKIAMRARASLAAKKRRSRQSDWLDIMERLGYRLNIDPGLVDLLVHRLVAPRNIKSGDSSLDETGVRQRPPRAQRAVALSSIQHHNVILHELNAHSSGVSTRDIGLPIQREWHDVELRRCDELFDPIAVMRDFMVAVVDVREDTAEHFIQHWVRQEFRLHYSVESRLALHRVCDELNARFYGGQSRSVVSRSGRPATMGIHTVIELIRRALELSDSRPPPADDTPAHYRQAVGTFLGLRLCGLFRHMTSVSVGDEPAELKAALHLRSCVSPFRRAEAGFVRTRIFGALTGIAGFKTIFRGGLLPHAEEGRAFVLRGVAGAGKTVLALKMVADAAYRGRLGVYITVEESLATIAGRLESFGMLDPRMFEVIVAGPDLAGQIRERKERGDGRGLLVLCALGSTDGHGSRASESALDPTVVIRQIAEAAGDRGRWKWRAVVVDSLTALELYDRSSNGLVQQEPARMRLALLQLVDTINRYRFWGILISEAGSQQNEIVSYVADTVIELGVDHENLTRWLRIDKCRTQAFQFGPHPFRLSETDGIRVYPSLSAVQSSLRRRIKATRSETETIPMPEAIASLATSGSVGAKSSVLISGPDCTGKSNLMLELLTSPQMRVDEGSTRRERFPSCVLVVTFRTNEQQYRQRIRAQRELHRDWERVDTLFRYFSPGRSLTPGQLIGDIRRYILRAQRESIPIERIAFDEVGSALSRIPVCARDPLMWNTLSELTSSLAITSFFVLTTTLSDDWLGEQLRSTADYVFETARDEQGLSVALTKTPDADEGVRASVRFGVSPGGKLIKREIHEGYLPDGRRVGIPVKVEDAQIQGVCSLRHRGCTADDQPAGLLRIHLPPSSGCLPTCPSCFRIQVESQSWRIQL